MRRAVTIKPNANPECHAATMHCGFALDGPPPNTTITPSVLGPNRSVRNIRELYAKDQIARSEDQMGKVQRGGQSNERKSAVRPTLTMSTIALAMRMMISLPHLYLELPVDLVRTAIIDELCWSRAIVVASVRWR